MPRVIIHKTTGRVGEFQGSATEGTLLKNISDNGGNVNDFEERIVTADEYRTLFANDPTRATERDIEVEAGLIAGRADKIQKDRERKEAVKELKQEGKTFSHFDDDGNRI